MNLSPDDFARMFGGEIDDRTRGAIAQYDWQFTLATPDASSHIILGLLHRLEKRQFSIAGENVERWQNGWNENLQTFLRTGDISALAPRYLRAAQYLRLHGQFIEPDDPMFEAHWYEVFRGWFARRYLAGFDAIYEFGCGSGHNVAFLAQEFPDKQIVGLDWTDASVEIVQALGERLPNVSGSRFDFFAPAELEFSPNAAVLTIGALEQTGTRWRPFLDFLRARRPTQCLHIEPIMEWYDTTNLVDHTAIRLHQARGFQQGLVDWIAPAYRHRTGFGSLMLEGYSQLMWKP